MGLCNWEHNTSFCCWEAKDSEASRLFSRFISWFCDRAGNKASDIWVTGGTCQHLQYEIWKLSNFSWSSSWFHKYFEFFFFSVIRNGWRKLEGFVCPYIISYLNFWMYTFYIIYSDSGPFPPSPPSCSPTYPNPHPFLLVLIRIHTGI